MTNLSQAARKFIRDWGELSDRWGVDRTTAEVHALLWLAGTPLDLKSVADALMIESEEAAHGLEALREAGIATLADRSGGSLRYAVPADAWEMFRAILEERRRRELEPAVAVIRDAVLRCDSDPEGDDRTRDRLEQLQGFLRDANTFYRQMSTMPAPVFRQLLRTGAKIRKALGLDAAP